MRQRCDLFWRVFQAGRRLWRRGCHLLVSYCRKQTLMMLSSDGNVVLGVKDDAWWQMQIREHVLKTKRRKLWVHICEDRIWRSTADWGVTAPLIFHGSFFNFIHLHNRTNSWNWRHAKEARCAGEIWKPGGVCKNNLTYLFQCTIYRKIIILNIIKTMVITHRIISIILSSWSQVQRGRWSFWTLQLC